MVAIANKETEMKMRMSLLCGGLFALLQLLAGGALAYNVGGTILNGTTNGAANIYVVLLNQGSLQSAGYGTTIASIPSGTATGFTIRGVPGGQYKLFSFMDLNSTGSLHTNDPFVSSSSFVVSGADVSIGRITLQTAAPPHPPAAPATLHLVAASDAALLIWDPPRYAYGGYGLNAELADSYTIHWGKSPDPGPGSELGSKVVPAFGGNYHVVIAGLTPGDQLYFRVQAHNQGGDAFSSSAGPFTIAPQTGGATVSGRVYTGGIPNGSGKPLYIALQGESHNYFVGHVTTTVTDPQQWSITGVPPGNYAVYAPLDLNNDGLLSGYIASQGMGGDAAAPHVIVMGGATAVAPDITLRQADGQATVTTQNGQNSRYQVGMRVVSGVKRPISATITGGPNITPPLDMGLRVADGSNSTFGAYALQANPGIKPATGDTYTVSVTYSDGATEILSSKVTNVVTAMATPIFPQGNTTAISTGTPLAWRSSGMPGEYEFSFRIQDQSNNLIWSGWNSNFTLPATRLFTSYNSDGSASQSQLSAGVTYYLTVSINDSFGNQGESQVNFTPQNGGPSITGFTTPSGCATLPSPACLAGVAVNIAGSGFTGASSVMFGGVSQPTFTVQNDNLITATVPGGAPVGPLTVTVAGVTTAGSASFPAAVTFTTGAQTFGAALLSNVTIAVTESSPNNFCITGSSGTCTLTVPSGVPYSLQLHDNSGLRRDTFSHRMVQTYNSIGSLNFTLFADPELPFSVANKGIMYNRVRDWDTNAAMPGVIVTATSFLHPDTPYIVYYSDPANTSNPPVTGNGSTTASDGKFYISNLDEGDIITVKGSLAGYFIGSNSYQTHTGGVSSGRLPATPLPIVTATPSGGNLAPGQTVLPAVSSPIAGDSYVIYYTLDGSDPTTSGSRMIYGAPLVLGTAPVVLKFYALNSTHNVAGAVMSAFYNFSFSGSVTTVGSSPLFGATIQVDGLPSCVTQAAVDGSFTLGCIPYDADFILKISDPGYLSTYSQSIRMTSSLSGAAYRLLTLAELPCGGSTPGKGTIIAQVSDTALIPVAGVVVTAGSYPVYYFDGVGSCGGAATGAGGLVVITNVNDNDPVTLNAAKSGWSFYPSLFQGRGDAVSQGAIMGVATNRNLTVTTGGSGSGTVNSTVPSSGLILCSWPRQSGDNCMTTLTYGTAVTLVAAPGSSSLATWSGCDSVDADFCSVTLTSDRTVSASFDLKPPVRIGAVYYGSLADAYLHAGSGAIMEAQAVTFLGDLLMNRGITVRVRGGFSSEYSTQPGYTLLQGKLIIGSGMVTVERLTVK